MFFRILLVVILCSYLDSTTSKNGQSFADIVPNLNAPVFVTYTTGGKERIDLTENLMRSLRRNSPGLANNSVIVCFDYEACRWCMERMSSEERNGLTASRCKCEDVVSQNGVTQRKAEKDLYASPAWSTAVIKKASALPTSHTIPFLSRFAC